MPVPLPVPINKEQKHNNSTTSIFRRHFYLQASMQKHHTQHGTNLDPHTHKLIVQVSNLMPSKPQSCPPSRKLEDHPWLHPVRHKDGTVRALVHLWFAHVPGMKIYENNPKICQNQPKPSTATVDERSRKSRECVCTLCSASTSLRSCSHQAAKSRRAAPTRRRMKHPLRDTKPPEVTKRPVWPARCWWPPKSNPVIIDQQKAPKPKNEAAKILAESKLGYHRLCNTSDNLDCWHATSGNNES